MRMLGSNGNPQAHNFIEIVAHPQKTAGLRLEVRSI